MSGRRSRSGPDENSSVAHRRRIGSFSIFSRGALGIHPRMDDGVFGMGIGLRSGEEAHWAENAD